MYLYTYLYFNNIIAHNSYFERCRKMEKRIQAISAAIYINGENWGVYRNWDSYKINNLENWKNLAQNQTSSVQHSQNRELYLIMENTVTINNNHILFNIQLIFLFKIHLSLIDIQNLIMKFSFSCQCAVNGWWCYLCSLCDWSQQMTRSTLLNIYLNV